MDIAGTTFDGIFKKEINGLCNGRIFSDFNIRDVLVFGVVFTLDIDNFF